jgi:hypothetical protein
MASNTGHRDDEVIVMTIVSDSPLRRALSRSARAVHRLYDEQAYAWDRLFWVGLPEPEQARAAADFRRWERELRGTTASGA